MKIGAHYLGNSRCEFIVWAPPASGMQLRIISPQECLIPMERIERGYWRVVAEDIMPGARYFYKVGGSASRPDPASFYQPNGVHASSEVVDHSAFAWSDDRWRGTPLEKMIIYEMHIGTFTRQGDFDWAVKRLDELRELGVNAIEVMPVSQFPGERNWGYDGAYPFSVQNSYGGPEGFKRFINACHEKEMAVILDVVYNHLGPEGNYLREFGPYFTDKYMTPWGKAVNFDDAYSSEVRNFFVQNSLYWLEYYHVDALRLDAVHSIHDMSPRHILSELSDEVEAFSKKRGRKLYLMAESDLNDTKIINKKELGGYTIGAQWCDDFHHSIHAALTGEKTGYYADFGDTGHIAKSLNEGFVYSGGYSSFRKKRHGSSSRELPANKFIVFIQNHDQVGNRAFGERLSTLISFEALKLAAAALFLSPYIPLIFMGEEYAEDAPFLYFTSHEDPDLIRAMREGRKKEFESFGWKKEPPDPQKEATFLDSKLKWEKRREGRHKVVLDFYKELIRLRKDIPALSEPDKKNIRVTHMEDRKIITIERGFGLGGVLGILNFNKSDSFLELDDFDREAVMLLDSSDVRWMGPGQVSPEKITKGSKVALRPLSFVLYKMEG